MEQIQFSFANNDNYNSEEFILSTSNHEAYDWLAKWPNENSTYKTLIMYGVIGSGKSHLSNIWLKRNEARYIYSEQFEKIISCDLLESNSKYLCEDIERISDEVMFFNFINYANRKNSYILFTSNKNPKDITFKLPDLESRILSIPTVKINPPDDDMLKMILIKFFSDRQLRISREVIDFIINRSDRSIYYLQDIVSKIDIMSMQKHKNITIPFIKQVLTVNH